MSLGNSAPFLTLLTPSWNRAHLLPRLQRSIAEDVPKKQPIEWLIVDDGSTDDTPKCVADFQANTAFPVRCYRTVHGGKHRALNFGFGQAAGRWILIIDSDDWFLPQGLARAIEEIEKAEKLGADAAFLPMNVVAAPTQHRFARPGQCVTFVDRMMRENWFDTSFVLSRRVCRARFPEIAGETYLAPGALLYDLDPTIKFYLSDGVCVAAEYQDDGLTRNNLRARMSSPVGNTITYSRQFKLPLSAKLRLRALLNFGRFWWHCKLQFKKPIGPSCFFQAAILPFSWPATLYDLWRKQL